MRAKVREFNVISSLICDSWNRPNFRVPLQCLESEPPRSHFSRPTGSTRIPKLSGNQIAKSIYPCLYLSNVCFKLSMSRKNINYFHLMLFEGRKARYVYIPDIKYVICHLYGNFMNTHSTSEFDKCCIRCMLSSRTLSKVRTCFKTTKMAENTLL